MYCPGDERGDSLILDEFELFLKIEFEDRIEYTFYFTPNSKSSLKLIVKFKALRSIWNLLRK
jgi:hypothetical protein